ncbi:MAG TPA: M20/M25/M40 family metallo-hydrolase [Aridibacter sp.]|nr:M20/M25/M40 family metallo-hydrolase [Aridibacter sp.]
MLNRRTLGMLVLLALCSAPFARAQKSNEASSIAERDVRAHMEFLASDAMKGRASGSEYELIAGEYLAAMMRQFGIEPAGDETGPGQRSYIQTIEITRQGFAGPPVLSYGTGTDAVTLTHGEEMIVFRMGATSSRGGLQKVEAGGIPEAGRVALIRYDQSDPEGFARRFRALFDSPAAAVLIEETPQFRAGWERSASRRISFTTVKGLTRGTQTSVIIVSTAAAEALSKLDEGTEISIGGELGEPEISRTWNSVGKIEGSDPALSKEVILLSAHMDHVGERPNTPGDDKIFNGADDDASGCTAVIELARVLARGERSKRTVYFAFFGSEEAGGFGSRYFAANLPFPKENFVANLQFEMIGRPDPAVAADELWLTGYDRSNLGAELAKRGAKIVADPHPQQNFFQRSDNYNLARQGIIAHTVSSYGLHKDYHQPTDEIGTIDFVHMTKAINSMIAPVTWLLNSDFRPSWYEGRDPSQ